MPQHASTHTSHSGRDNIALNCPRRFHLMSLLDTAAVSRGVASLPPAAGHVVGKPVGVPLPRSHLCRETSYDLHLRTPTPHAIRHHSCSIQEYRPLQHCSRGIPLSCGCPLTPQGGVFPAVVSLRSPSNVDGFNSFDLYHTHTPLFFCTLVGFPRSAPTKCSTTFCLCNPY